MRDSVLATLAGETGVQAGAAGAANACAPQEAEPLLVSNTQMSDFRMIVAHAAPVAGKLALSAEEMALLHCQGGEPVRTLPLNVRKNVHV